MSRTSIVERDTSTISEYLISVSITSGLVRGVAEVGNNRRTRDGWIKSTNVNVNGEGGKVGESKSAGPMVEKVGPMVEAAVKVFQRKL